jgi:DnaK suppressor protein
MLRGTYASAPACGGTGPAIAASLNALEGREANMAVATEQHEQLHQALLDRRTQLTAEIEEGAQQRRDQAQYATPGAEPGDVGDASTGIEQADLRNAQIERDLLELRAIEGALERYEQSKYGLCTRCGSEIGIARLRASPAAERCIECQIAFERQYAGNTTPSL